MHHPDPLQAFLESVGETIRDFARDLTSNLWRYRLELFTLIVAAGGYLFLNRTTGPASAIGGLLLIPAALLDSTVRRHVFRAFRAQHTKRQWTRADPGTRAVRVHQVPAGDVLTVTLSNGDTLEDLEQRATKIATHLSNRQHPVREVRVSEHPDGRADAATVLVVRRDPFKNAAPIPWPLLNAEQTSVWDRMPYGVYDDGEPVSLQVMGNGHILIAGVTGSGKSVSLHVFVAHTALDPNARLVLLDNKQVELFPWALCADAFIGPNMRDAATAMQAVQAQMQTRLDNLLNYRDEHGNRTRKITGGATTTVFIDELSYYLTHKDQKSVDDFNVAFLDILQRGRAVGVRIVAAMQRPSAKLIDSDLREQFGTRIAHRVKQAETTTMILGDRESPAHKIPDEGYEGVGYLGSETAATRRFRAPFLSEQDVDVLADRATQLRAGQELEHLLKEYAPPPVEKPQFRAAESRMEENRRLLLGTIPEHGSVTFKDIERTTGKSRQEISPVLKALVTDGSVVREPEVRRGNEPFRYRAVRNTDAQGVRTPPDAPPPEP